MINGLASLRKIGPTNKRPDELHKPNELKTYVYYFNVCLLGYLEDRRPASNMDPYVVTALLAETTLLYEPTLEAEALAAQKIALKV